MSDSPVGTRAKRAPVERRNRDDAVLQAAISVMSERGYSGMSIQEVADRVGVLKGSLYHYFASKEELLFRILDESQRESDAITEEVADLGLPPAGELAEYLRRQSIWYLENVDRANIYFSETRNLTGANRELTDRRGREFVAHVRNLVIAAQDQGTITSPLDPRLITRYILGGLNSVRAWKASSGIPFTNETMADAFVEMTMNAVGAKQ